MGGTYQRSVRGTDLCRHLLGLEKPWIVGRVELDVKQPRVGRAGSSRRRWGGDGAKAISVVAESVRPADRGTVLVL